jgi:hypothetical protein
VSSRPATLLPGYALLALAWASSAGMCVLGRAGTGAMLGAITAVCAVLAGRELRRPGLSPAAERAARQHAMQRAAGGTRRHSALLRRLAVQREAGWAGDGRDCGARDERERV